MSKSIWQELIKNVKPLRSKKIESNDGEDCFCPNEECSITVSYIDPQSLKRRPQKIYHERDLKIGDASRIDKSLETKIKKGKVQNFATLDLHGKTLTSAFSQFITFINDKYNGGVKTIVVITGKGNPQKGTGIIRKEFENWLNHDDVRDKILYVNQAPHTPFNDGAFYVILRSKKS